MNYMLNMYSKMQLKIFRVPMILTIVKIQRQS
jgi:hypothetical protein